MNKGIVISLDMDFIDHAEKVVQQTIHMPEVSGYKIGSVLGLTYGLQTVMNRLFPDKYITQDKQLIFDYQKAGNDISDLAQRIAGLVKAAGFTHMIIFPFTSVQTGLNWTREIMQEGLLPIVGHRLTERSTVLHGMLSHAWDIGVRNFVISGKDETSAIGMNFLYNTEKEHVNIFVPGIGAQGGSIDHLKDIKFRGIFPIVGRSIYNDRDPRNAMLRLYHEELFS